MFEMAQQSHIFRKTDLPINLRLILRILKEAFSFTAYFGENGLKKTQILGLLASKIFVTASVFVSILFTTPLAYAGMFSFVTDLFASDEPAPIENPSNSQNMALLQAAINLDPNPLVDDGDFSVIDGSLLLAENGPAGSFAETAKNKHTSDSIVVYTVREGETLSQIAKSFGVTVDTIVWANDNITRASSVKAGQKITILPISGTQHIVKKGDTIKSVASLYKGDINEILDYNGLSADAKLVVGDTIIIPDGEIQIASAPKTSGAKIGSTISVASGYYMRPVTGGRKTQGIHGRNGVDIASYSGAPIFASATGDVLISKSTGWNGGYGKYIVVGHPNGTQTLYAHLSENYVAVGARVNKGETIGAMGSTGNSTGTHLHFEIRGAKNPF
jgi:murein DD-endopeptidase MepM/ murein hydrolase activator NlpD